MPAKVTFRLTVSLPDDLLRKLRAESRRRRIGMAELLRRTIAGAGTGNAWPLLNEPVIRWPGRDATPRGPAIAQKIGGTRKMAVP